MEIQLQSTLLPSEEICRISELYYHRRGRQVDFDGYFNLFYIKKRKAYTSIEELFLLLNLKGYEELILYHDRTAISRIRLEAGEEKEYRIPVPYEAYSDGVFWYSLWEAEKEEDGKQSPDGKQGADGRQSGNQGQSSDEIQRPGEEPVSNRGQASGGERHLQGMFVASVREEQVCPVNIGIDICTYRREAYVARNLTQLMKGILNRTELDAASHLRIYVADNGRTLEGQEEIQRLAAGSRGRIQIFPNKNAGGAGGFTRGILEVLEEKEACQLTHVLLMDDDVTLDPDLLVRLYGLLATLKEPWREASVGGALMREDYPYVLLCAGEVWENGVVKNPEKNLDLRDFDTASCPYLTEPGREREWYSGWWCCCYSLKTVGRDNLPLPLFIHRDDIEFCLRNQQKGMLFLNGIGVWHKAFDLTFESSTLYYDIRNELITILLHGTGNKKKTARNFVIKAMITAAIRMRYPDGEAVYQGTLDFLKGPEWLWSQDGEALNRKVRQKACQYRPMDEIFQQLPQAEAGQLQRQLEDFLKGFTMERIRKGPWEGKKGSWIHYLTLNGLLLPGDWTQVKLMTTLDSPWEAFRKGKVVWYEPGSGRGLLVKRDYRKLLAIARRTGKLLLAFHRHYDRAAREYEEKMTAPENWSAWKEYLKEK